MTFNIILRKLRTDNNLLQKNVASICNVKQNSYAQWEAGKTQPDIDNILILSRYYNVSTDYLLGIENDDFTSNYNIDKVLPADEERLLQEYRKLDKPLKKMCYYYVEHMVTAATLDKENKNHG